MLCVYKINIGVCTVVVYLDVVGRYDIIVIVNDYLTCTLYKHSTVCRSNYLKWGASDRDDINIYSEYKCSEPLICFWRIVIMDT